MRLRILGGVLRVHVAVALCASTSLAVETIVLKQEVTESRSVEGGEMKKRVTNQTLSIAPGRIRLDRADGTFLLLDFDKGMLYDADTLLKSYREKDIRNFEEKWKKANDILLKQIEGTPAAHPRRGELIDQLTDGPSKWDLIWKMPPSDARDSLLKKYNLPPAPPEIKVEKTDEKKLVAGYECLLYRVLEDGKLRSFAWVAPAVPLEKDLAEFLRVTGVLEENIARELARVKGFPLEYAMHWRDGRLEHTVSASSEKKNFGKDFFDLPRDFVKEQAKSGF